MTEQDISPTDPLAGPLGGAPGGRAARGRAAGGGRVQQSRRWRMAGRLLRDGLLVLVLLAMGLPYLVAAIGGPSLDESQEEMVRAARHAALVEQDWLGNSMTNKVTDFEPLPGGGYRVCQRFYTFFGLPWGWYEAEVAGDGTVSGLTTGLGPGG